MTAVSQTWTEPSTLDVTTATTLSETLWDTAMSNALYSGRECEPLFTNNGAGTITAGMVVIIDSTLDLGCKTTTTASNSYVLGVAMQTILPSAQGRLANRGICNVLVQGTVTRAQWLATSTTDGRAFAVASAGTASFALALTSYTGAAGTVQALLRI